MDSQRVAFLVCVGFRDYSVMRGVNSSIAHPLAKCYVILAFRE